MDYNTRKSGEFHFAHIISGLLSYIDTRPITITSEKFKDIQEKQTEYLSKIDFSLLSNYIKSLNELNGYLTKHKLEQKWLAKEVVISGLFAALGDYKKKNEQSDQDTFNFFSTLITKEAEVLNVSGFDEATKQISISGNIGKLYRDAIYKAIQELLLKKEKIQWTKHFQNN